MQLQGVGWRQIKGVPEGGARESLLELLLNGLSDLGLFKGAREPSYSTQLFLWVSQLRAAYLAPKTEESVVSLLMHFNSLPCGSSILGTKAQILIGI